MIILFVNKYMLFERINISLTVNKYIISLKLNKYNSLNLHKYTVAGCKIMPALSANIFCLIWMYVFLEFYIIYKRPTIVNFEWSRKQIQVTIY